MPFMVKAGAKSIGVIKRKSKKAINSLLAKEYRKKTRVSVLKIGRKMKR